MDKKYVSYKDFGAIGDGITNDFFAMKAAHEYANEKGLPVRAEADKTYLVSSTVTENGEASYISVKTDTDFCGATVIIDDTSIQWEAGEKKQYMYGVFFIESYYPRTQIEQKYIDKINAEGGIKKGVTKKIETGLGYPAMLVFFNENTRHFIRFGGNQNSGSPQKELAVFDKDGNLDESTPFLFDFDSVSSITAVRIDIPTLRFENVTIHSKSSRININPEYHSIGRGIAISRPNTHIYNVKHEIEGELGKYEPVYCDENGLSYSAAQDGYSYRDGIIYDKDGNEYRGDDVKAFIGHSYNGFLTANTTHNVLFEKVSFQARVYYLQGTYDMSATMVNMLVLKDCDQVNFYGGHDPEYPRMLAFGKWWGVAGTNFCKNMIYDGCRLTRYDAHSGVTNGKIINSEVGSIRLTGGGDMLIENTKIYFWSTYSPIQLREDYGVTWNGTITFKNSKMESVRGEITPACILIMQSANHFFGYKTHFPNLVFDNFKIENSGAEVRLLNEFEMKPENQYFYRSVRDENLAVEGALCYNGEPNVNPYAPPEFIKVVNNEENGYELTVPDVPFFKNTEKINVKTVE